MFHPFDCIEFFNDVENLQMCHIQIASKDPEIFEYAIEQIRNHVAQVYGEYMKTFAMEWHRFHNELFYRNCPKDYLTEEEERMIDDDILIKKGVVKPSINMSTYNKLAQPKKSIYMAAFD